MNANRLDALERWQVGYLAGYLDGEGTFGVYKVNDKPQLQIKANSTTFNVLRTLHWLTGMGSIQDVPVRNKKWKPQKYWRVTSYVEANELLSAIAPFLLVKRKQAELLLDYCSERLSDSPAHGYEYYYKQTKMLNHEREVIENA